MDLPILPTMSAPPSQANLLCGSVATAGVPHKASKCGCGCFESIWISVRNSRAPWFDDGLDLFMATLTVPWSMNHLYTLPNPPVPIKLSWLYPRQLRLRIQLHLIGRRKHLGRRLSLEILASLEVHTPPDHGNDKMPHHPPDHGNDKMPNHPPDHGNDKMPNHLSSSKKRSLWLIIGVPAAFVLVLIPVSFICYMPLRNRNSSENMQNSYRTNPLMLELSIDLSAIEEFSNTQMTKLSGKKDYDLPFFSLQSIEIATCHFSDANKIGRGGFGLVYKGKFDSGQEIAVKRLSRNSGQGLEEFKNEVILISKLQHRNLVRLLGCCIEREERILIYEYMPNGSLDSFLFDATKRPLINWQLRFRIIEGIAQGLLYLHKYSRLRIIHRDLKTSNILLDIQMNPKISDFGTARIFKENESQANTRRIVGTHGYMSPEYAMDGLFSIKSDVFSFGVMILEIISGKRNTIAFHRTDCSLNLIGYAWELWKEGRGLELMESSLAEGCSTTEFIRCVQIGLLCVQESAAERPNMSQVLSMLTHEMLSLPAPKEPPIFATESADNDVSQTNSKPSCSNNNLTISEMEGR